LIVEYESTGNFFRNPGVDLRSTASGREIQPLGRLPAGTAKKRKEMNHHGQNQSCQGGTQVLPNFMKEGRFTQTPKYGGTEMNEKHATNNTTESELVITRTFDAPRDFVFKMWTEPEHLKHWWGPKGFTFGVSKFDLRPDGVFHYSMTSPDGHEMWGKFVYREFVAPERIVFIHSFSDEEGNTVRAPFGPTWPLEVLNTLTLSENEGKTTLTLRGGPVNATEEERKTYEARFESMKQGFAGTFDQLAEYLAKAI
jgi:uncharacterized protein YndB with AHSA1/START domain